MAENFTAGQAKAVVRIDELEVILAAGPASGGERRGVVQVISATAVQAELKLNNEQQQQVGDLLRRVKAMEEELFEDFRRSQQEQSKQRTAATDRINP